MLYTFENTLTDLAGGSTLTVLPNCGGSLSADDPCNNATSFGTDGAGPYWTWTSPALNGGGFRVTTNQLIGSTYTMILKFSFISTGPGYRKIIDYKNRVSDTGFYFRQAGILFYNLGSRQGSFAANEVLNLVVVRQAFAGVAGLFTVYSRVEGGGLQLLVNVTDSTGQSIPFTSGNGSFLGFFYDDLSVQGEATPGGKAYRLQMWENIALTPSQLAEITNGAFIQQNLEPPSSPPLRHHILFSILSSSSFLLPP